MKIKTSITQEREDEISVPMFKMYKSTLIPSVHYLGVLNEKTAIHFATLPDYVNINSSTPESMNREIVEALNWEDITEEEFLEAYDIVLSGLSLTAQLIDPDDLKNVL